ncbi:hypothetical protein [uncultured Hoeflea sp.]|uniref:hypothetical protein n=1 Tax=uncultured Hoeflea sp. TaxID=538666 RepID=UPI002616828C|nr:hypothetical protein [uncultured Hoeflea sp.]
MSISEIRLLIGRELPDQSHSRAARATVGMWLTAPATIATSPLCRLNVGRAMG